MDFGVPFSRSIRLRGRQGRANGAHASHKDEESAIDMAPSPLTCFMRPEGAETKTEESDKTSPKRTQATPTLAVARL